MKKERFGVIVCALLLPIIVFGAKFEKPSIGFTGKDTVRWQRVITGVLGGDTLPGMWTGGLWRNKPAFCDINGDGKLDILLGGWNGRITYYENIGTTTAPKFQFVTDFFDSVDVMWGAGMVKGYSAPAFSDVYDDSGHRYLYCGDYMGKTHIYKNIGTATSPNFVYEDTLHYSVVRHACPAFCDVYNKGKPDLFVGGEDGWLYHFINNLTPADSDAGTGWTYDTDWYVPDTGSTGPAFGQVSPAFCDIRNVGRYDLFVTGQGDGTQLFYFRNDGTADSPVWSFITDFYAGITVDSRMGPAFADITGDGKFDLFVGAEDGKLRYCPNIGTPDSAVFAPAVTDQYLYLDLGGEFHLSGASMPTFTDLYKTGMMDMYVGMDDGSIYKLKNLGNNSWSKPSEYGGIAVDKNAAPTFCYLDNDTLEDLFVGNSDGTIWEYKIIPDKGHKKGGKVPPDEWKLVSSNFANVNVVGNSTPMFYDIDKDGDYDLFVGNVEGKVAFYRNDGTPTIPQFTFVTDNVLNPKVPSYAVPCFADVNDDGKDELLVGCQKTTDYGNSGDASYVHREYGVIYEYENTGDSLTPNWTLVDTTYDGIDVGRNAAPCVVKNVDGLGGIDLFVGDAGGGVNFWRNLNPAVEENPVSQKVKIDISPNPFSQKTVIELGVQSSELKGLQVRIYDLSGRLVKSLPAMSHIVIKLDNPGVYFCKISYGKSTMIKKLICIR